MCCDAQEQRAPRATFIEARSLFRQQSVHTDDWPMSDSRFTHFGMSESKKKRICSQVFPVMPLWSPLGVVLFAEDRQRVSPSPIRDSRSKIRDPMDPILRLESVTGAAPPFHPRPPWQTILGRRPCQLAGQCHRQRCSLPIRNSQTRKCRHRPSIIQRLKQHRLLSHPFDPRYINFLHQPSRSSA